MVVDNVGQPERCILIKIFLFLRVNYEHRFANDLPGTYFVLLDPPSVALVLKNFEFPPFKGTFGVVDEIIFRQTRPS